MRRRLFTVPNQLTFLRLGLLPLYFISIVYGRWRTALLLLVLAGLTDGLDGLMARRLDQKTELGTFLDPIADKLLLSISFVLLAYKKEIGWWLAILVLARDAIILIIATVILLVVGFRTFPPTFTGKSTTVLQILLVVVVISGAAFSYPWHERTQGILEYAAAALTVVSGVQYSVLIARGVSSK